VGHAHGLPGAQGRGRARDERAEVHPRLRPEDREGAVAARAQLEHHRRRRRCSTAT
jgi:hypothetical protein